MSHDRIRSVVEETAAGLSTGSRSTRPTFAEEVKTIRLSLGLSQEAFCQRYRIPIANLRNWEQAGRKVQPGTAARLLIEMIKVDPERVAQIVSRTQAMVDRPMPLDVSVEAAVAV